MRLSPLYDLSSQLPYKDKIPQRVAMKVGRHYETGSIRRTDWEALQRQCKLPDGSVIERLRSLAKMLPDHVIDARHQALRADLDVKSVRETSSQILKNVEICIRTLR